MKESEKLKSACANALGDYSAAAANTAAAYDDYYVNSDRWEAYSAAHDNSWALWEVYEAAYKDYEAAKEDK